MAWNVIRPGQTELRQVESGINERLLIGSGGGSVHFELAEVVVDPGAEITGHNHPFEESFYVLDGAGVVTIGAAAYAVEKDDFALAPLGIPHAWANPHDQPMHLLRVRAPQPRQLRGAEPHFLSPDFVTRTEGIAPPREVAAPHRPVGRFDSSQLPPPGPLNMRGYRGPRVSGVSLWMLIDELVGATHHTMFVVEFAPGADRQSAGDHFHPFEEAYYFVAGSAIAHLEGEDVPIVAGDLVFCGVNALHGYSVVGDEPVRWIEVQAPAPPPSGGTFFPDDWIDDRR